MLVIGRITGLYGLRGWVKVFSETDPREGILRYSPWHLGKGREPRALAEGRLHGKGIVARLAGCDDRDQAALLVGQEIAIRRDQLPPPSQDEVYWADLEGLAVETAEGVPLGVIERLFATPGNDVLVVRGERERLIPFLWDDVVLEVDFERGLVRVDWDPAF
jgi:16S rRNA processing protein RimM